MTRVRVESFTTNGAASLPVRRAVLLHGLGRSSASMRPVERCLKKHGFTVLNLGYPSRSASIAELATTVADQLALWYPSDPLDFVTHSLGGILIRQAVMAGRLPAARVHRIVMLGPPNRGSELADRLPSWPIVGPFYRWFTGPAGSQLGTDAQSIPTKLPSVPFETGVIAGTRSYNPLFSALLGKPNDGKVRLDRAGVDGMRDFVAVPYWHPVLMRPASVHALILRFLASGTFRLHDTPG